MKAYVVGKYLGLFFECVVSTLQLLHLLLGGVVLSHIGPLCGNGLQRTAVTQDFFIEKLEGNQNKYTHTFTVVYLSPVGGSGKHMYGIPIILEEHQKKKKSWITWRLLCKQKKNPDWFSYHYDVLPWSFPGWLSCLSSQSIVCLSSSASPPLGSSTTQTDPRPPDSWSTATERPPVDCDNRHNDVTVAACRATDRHKQTHTNVHVACKRSLI